MMKKKILAALAVLAAISSCGGGDNTSAVSPEGCAELLVSGGSSGPLAGLWSQMEADGETTTLFIRDDGLVGFYNTIENCYTPANFSYTHLGDDQYRLAGTTVDVSCEFEARTQTIDVAATSISLLTDSTNFSRPAGLVAVDVQCSTN